MTYCGKCGKEFKDDFKPGRNESCPNCGRDLRICLNCQFYAPGRQHDCSEHIEEGVKEKDRGNFCDWFKMKHADSFEAIQQSDSERKKEEARRKLEQLFK